MRPTNIRTKLDSSSRATNRALATWRMDTRNQRAESFGAGAYRAANPAELRNALERAFKDDAPVVIEVKVERGSGVSPWPFIHPEPPQ